MCYEKKFLSFRQFVIAALTLALCLLPLDLPIAKAASLTKSYKQFGENNPIVTQRYSADSGVMVYNDTVYVYCTNDEFEYSGGTIAENSYSKIKTLNCFSSKDLVNWTDHGTISVAGPSGAAKWASCSWAPCAAHKTINGKEKFFLYFANNASGIGVLTADSPTGPWRDPIGRPLITGATPNCSGVTWCFDPAVFVDDDGTGYLCFGGGIPNSQFAHPKTTRIVKLSNDMTSLAGTPVTIDAPYVFEDSGINKIGGKYYYSYCSNWNTSGSRYSTAAIEYMVSDSPTGPYTYAGELFKNPGVFFGTWGNNHHSLFEFKGNYYLAYHARALETAQIGKSLGNRSTQIDKLTIRNGVISPLTATMKGVSQTSYVNPYQTVQAETMANQAGIQVSGTGNTEITGISSGDWTCVKGVSFQKGASSIQARVHSNSEGKIRVYSGSPSGALLGTIIVPNTYGQYQNVSGTISSVTGVHDLYFVFEGSFAFDSWSILPANGGTTPSTPTTPPVSSGTLQDGWYYIKNVNAQKYL